MKLITELHEDLDFFEEEADDHHALEKKNVNPKKHHLKDF